MAFTYAILSDMVIQGLYEYQGLWNMMNRSFDGLISSQAANSVLIPKNPQLIVSKTGVATNSASRKKTKADTTTVQIDLNTYTIPLTDEVESGLFHNTKLLQNFLRDAPPVLSDQLDADVIAEAQTTDQIISWSGAKLGWGDIVALDAKFNTLKVPRRFRVCVIPAALQGQFMDIDIVKNAMAFNKDLLEKGVFVINNTQFYISSYVENVGGKQNIVGIYTQGLAVILKGMMDRKEVYDPENRRTHIDWNTGAGMKLFRNEYAVVSTAP